MVEILEIWPRETGITDLPEDYSRLALASMDELRRDWAIRRAEMDQLGILHTFSDQLAREWAIETGQIENLYDIERGVTLSLIEQGFSAALLERGSTNKPPEYVLALINDQKDALEGLFEFVKQDRPLSTGYIKDLHAAMTRSQELTEAVDPQGNQVEVPLLRGEWKKTPNFPVRDGKQFRYCPPEQTASEMDRLVQMHLGQLGRNVPPETMAAWIHHRFTQIHPFQDGNGRVARALATLILIRGEMFPLIIPREEKHQYLATLENADQGDLRPFILVLARRQQAEFRRSNRLFSGLLEHSPSTGDAAKLLAKTLAQAHQKRKHLRKEKLERLSELAKNILSEHFRTAMSLIRESIPSARVTGELTWTTSGQLHRYLGQVLVALRADPESAFIEINLHIGATYSLLVGIGAFEADFEDKAVLISVLDLPKDTSLLLDQRPILSLDEDPSANEDLIRGWAKTVATIFLDRIHQQVLTD